MKIKKYLKILLISLLLFSFFIRTNLYAQLEKTSALKCNDFGSCVKKAHSSKDPQTRLEYFSQALLLWKDADGIRNKAGAYYDRAVTYLSLKQYDKVISDFTKAIELDPEVDYYYHARGLTYEFLKQYDKAISDYNKAIELNPANFIAYEARGRVYAFLKQYDKAMNDYNKIIELKLSPKAKVAIAYSKLGAINLVLGKKKEGISNLNKSIETYTTEINKHPTNILYNSRGWSYLWLGECEEAKSDFEKAIEIDKNFAYPYRDLGIYWWHCKKNKNKALYYFKKAFQKGFDRWDELYDETSAGHFIKDLNKTPEFKKLVKEYKNKQESNQ